MSIPSEISNDGSNKDLLAPIRELLSDPKRWTTHVPARTADGSNTWYRSPAAVCWCLWGAYMKETEACDPQPLFWEIERRVLSHGHHTLAGFNDEPGRTHAEVVELLREPFYG